MLDLYMAPASASGRTGAPKETAQGAEEHMGQCPQTAAQEAHEREIVLEKKCTSERTSHWVLRASSPKSCFFWSVRLVASAPPGQIPGGCC